MKKITTKGITVVLVLAIAFSIANAVTETHTKGTKTQVGGVFSVLKKAEIVATGLSNLDFTQTMEAIYGVIVRISVVLDASEDAYDLTLKDENGITIFSKASIDSNSVLGYS